MKTERPRTNKCGPITGEMSWQERLHEYRKLGDDPYEAMSLSPQERAMVMFDMFTEHRRAIIDSLPKNLSEREFKRQLYFRTYGEPLPDDVFKDEEKGDVKNS